MISADSKASIGKNKKIENVTKDLASVIAQMVEQSTGKPKASCWFGSYQGKQNFYFFLRKIIIIIEKTSTVLREKYLR